MSDPRSGGHAGGPHSRPQGLSARAAQIPQSAWTPSRPLAEPRGSRRTPFVDRFPQKIRPATRRACAAPSEPQLARKSNLWVPLGPRFDRGSRLSGPRAKSNVWCAKCFFCAPCVTFAGLRQTEGPPGQLRRVARTEPCEARGVPKIDQPPIGPPTTTVRCRPRTSASWDEDSQVVCGCATFARIRRLQPSRLPFVDKTPARGPVCDTSEGQGAKPSSRCRFLPDALGHVARLPRQAFQPRNASLRSRLMGQKCGRLLENGSSPRFVEVLGPLRGPNACRPARSCCVALGSRLTQSSDKPGPTRSAAVKLQRFEAVSEPAPPWP